MRRKRAVLLIAVLLAAAVAKGQTPPKEQGGDLRSELTKLNKSVREIADLLAKQAEGQKLDLLMKRIELSSTRVGQMEQRLRSLQTERTDLEEQRQGMEMQLQELQASAESGASEVSRAELEAALGRAESHRKHFASRLQAVGQELTELEGRLSSQQEELRGWQRFVDKRLSSF
jgi:chromosome segregation ATPase